MWTASSLAYGFSLMLTLITAALGGFPVPHEVGPEAVVHGLGTPMMGMTEHMVQIRRALYAFARRDTSKTKTVDLATNMDGLTLFRNNFMHIDCQTCYLGGIITVQLDVKGNFSVDQAVDSLKTQVAGEIKEIYTNFTSAAKDVLDKVVLAGSLDAFTIPTMDINFDIDVPPMPETSLQFRFPGLELYVKLNTGFRIAPNNPNMAFRLFTAPAGILGITVGNNVALGVFVTLDLVLETNRILNVTGGFHIKVDAAAFNLEMFGEKVSSMSFDGARFELIPVEVHVADSVDFKASLAVSLHAGFEVSNPDTGLLSKVGFRAGAGVAVFANLAEFGIKIPNPAAQTVASPSTCTLPIEVAYQFAIGHGRGATIAIGQTIFGPHPRTTIPIYSTTFGEGCAGSGPPTTQIAARTPQAGAPGPGMTVTTTTTSVTYTNVACRSPGLVNCPVSLQTTDKFSSRTVITATLSSGEKLTLPLPRNTAVTTVGFGQTAHRIGSTSGAPAPFTPGAEASWGDGRGGLSKKDRDIAIGVGLGLGVPVLVAIIAGICLYRKKRTSATSATTHSTSNVSPRPSRGTWRWRGLGRIRKSNASGWDGTGDYPNHNQQQAAPPGQPEPQMLQQPIATQYAPDTYSQHQTPASPATDGSSHGQMNHSNYANYAGYPQRFPAEGAAQMSQPIYVHYPEAPGLYNTNPQHEQGQQATQYYTVDNSRSYQTTRDGHSPPANYSTQSPRQ